MTSAITARSLGPLVLGWSGVAALAIIAPDPSQSLAASVAWLIAIVAVIVVCAFGVLGHAEELARRLGDPYGTLVLTLSIVTIEVALIGAVLFGPGDNETVARDATMAAAVLFPGLFLGVGLLIGTLRHGPLQFNRAGLSSYLTMLIALGSIAFVLPGFIGVDGAYTTGQAILVILVTSAAYGFFLWQQIGPRARDFQEVSALRVEQETPSTSPAWLHGLILFLTAAAIVLLSHDMAGLLDTVLARTSAPVAVSGLLITTIVMLPEGLTTLRAAWFGEIQRVSNLTHGAMVSVVGLTIPTVLTIGLITGQRIVFAESATNIAFLAILALISLSTLGAKRATPVHAVVLLVVSVMYLVSIFS